VVGAEKAAGRGGRARRRQWKLAEAGRGRRRGSADAIAMALLCRSNGGSIGFGFSEAATHLRPLFVCGSVCVRFVFEILKSWFIVR
jgi:hypothetical protein